MGKTLIKVECVDQRLLVSSGPIIASGGRNEDEIEFGFCPLWDEFEKTAVFYREKDQVYHSIIVDNRCVIPHEVLIDEGWLYFGVMGVKGDITRTSEIMKYRVAEGAITEGTKPSDPTPDIYEQILNQLSATNKRLDQMGGSSLEPQPFEVTGDMVQIDNFEGMPMNCVTHIEPVQVGSGDPSPDNVRPITGYAGAKLTKCGKNLIADDKLTIQDKNIRAYVNDPDGFLLLGGTTYTLSLGDTPADAVYVTTIDKAGGDGDIAKVYTKTSVMFTPSENIRAQFNAYWAGGRPDNAYMQLELGSTATDYAPYTGETFSANFGQTVYGGTLDWNTGMLTVDRAVASFTGNENWRRENNYTVLWNAIPPALYNGGDTQLCSHYTTRYDWTYGNMWAQQDGTVVLPGSADAFPAADDWKACLSAQYSAGTPVQLCYKLAEPTVIQLTPAQIIALQGMNNIWCDAGETTVSGRKDILWLTNDLINQIAELRAAIISLGGNV